MSLSALATPPSGWAAAKTTAETISAWIRTVLLALVTGFAIVILALIGWLAITEPPGIVVPQFELSSDVSLATDPPGVTRSFRVILDEILRVHATVPSYASTGLPALPPPPFELPSALKALGTVKAEIAEFPLEGVVRLLRTLLGRDPYHVQGVLKIKDATMNVSLLLSRGGTVDYIVVAVPTPVPEAGIDIALRSAAHKLLGRFLPGQPGRRAGEVMEALTEGLRNLNDYESRPSGTEPEDPRETEQLAGSGPRADSRPLLRRAVARLATAVELDRANAYARYHLARALMIAGENEDALAHLRVVARDPRLHASNVDYLLGSALERTGKWGEAIQPLERFVARFPDFHAARINLAWAISETAGQPNALRQAIGILHAVPATDRNYYRARRDIAAVHGALLQRQAALDVAMGLRRDLESGAAIVPPESVKRHWEFHAQLADLAVCAHKFSEALQAADRAARLAPSVDPDWIVTRAYVRIVEGTDLAVARELLLAAGAMAPTGSEANRYARVRAYLALAERDFASARAILTSRSTPLDHAVAALASLGLGQPETAAAEVGTAARAERSMPLRRGLDHARQLIEHGRSDEAQRALRKLYCL